MAAGDVVSTLNGLIAICRDAEQGFRTAARAVHAPDVHQIFTGYAEQRAQFTGELTREVLRLGGAPETAGSMAASLHRGWMSLKAALTGGDAEAIIAAAETGEDSAVRAGSPRTPEGPPAAAEAPFGILPTP